MRQLTYPKCYEQIERLISVSLAVNKWKLFLILMHAKVTCYNKGKVRQWKISKLRKKEKKCMKRNSFSFWIGKLAISNEEEV